MKIKNKLDKIFKEMVYEYENEKMIKNRGYVQKTTSVKFLGGLKDV